MRARFTRLLIVPTAQPADARGIFVRKALRPDEEHGLALILRQPRQRRPQILEIEMGLLVRRRPQGRGVAPVGVLDLAPTLAIFGVEEVAKDREEPGVQIGAGLESVDVGERPQERILDEVVGAVDIPVREIPKARRLGTAPSSASRMLNAGFII